MSIPENFYRADHDDARDSLGQNMTRGIAAAAKSAI
jgi:hypothetical protein